MGRITALFLVGGGLRGLGFGWLGDRLADPGHGLEHFDYSVSPGLCFFARMPWLGPRCVSSPQLGWVENGRSGSH